MKKAQTFKSLCKQLIY